jgi:hypothetical protein
LSEQYIQKYILFYRSFTYALPKIISKCNMSGYSSASSTGSSIKSSYKDALVATVQSQRLLDRKSSVSAPAPLIEPAKAGGRHTGTSDANESTISASHPGKQRKRKSVIVESQTVIMKPRGKTKSDKTAPSVPVTKRTKVHPPDVDTGPVDAADVSSEDDLPPVPIGPTNKRQRKSKKAKKPSVTAPPVVADPRDNDFNLETNLDDDGEEEEDDLRFTDDEDEDEDDADMGEGGQKQRQRKASPGSQTEDFIQLAQDISVAAAEELQTRRNPTFQGLKVGTAGEAVTGAVFVVIERGDDSEITSRRVFQVKEPVALDGAPGVAVCIATNDEDTYTGSATDEHIVIKLPIESHHRFAWLDKQGFDRVLQPGAGFRAIWEALRRPYQPFGRRAAGAPKPPQKRRLLSDPLDDGVESNDEPERSTFYTKKSFSYRDDGESDDYPELPDHLVDTRPALKKPLQCKGKSGYGDTKTHMYTVPDGLLRAPVSSTSASLDAAQGKRNATASKTIVQKIGSGNLPDLLLIISAGETRDILSEDIAEVTVRMLKWRAVPISPYTMEQLLKSWQIPDGSDGLKWFVSLTTAHGTAECGALVERYRYLTKGYVGDAIGHHSPAFLSQFSQGTEANYLDGHISRMADALNNLIAAITVLYSMRYCYQFIMFRSVSTLVAYFRVRNFGQQSEVMLPFMRGCAAAMMIEWEDFRQEICNYRRTDAKVTKAALLARGRAIPDLGKHGSIETLYNHFFHKNDGQGVAAALLLNYSAGSEVVSKKAGGGKKTKKKKASAQPGAAGVASPSSAGADGSPSSKLAAPTPNNARPTGTMKKYCYGYNSSGGCDKSSTVCNFQHENPPKNSPGAQYLVEYFKKNPSVVASQNFSKYSV